MIKKNLTHLLSQPEHILKNGMVRYVPDVKNLKEVYIDGKWYILSIEGHRLEEENKLQDIFTNSPSEEEVEREREAIKRRTGITVDPSEALSLAEYLRIIAIIA